MIRNTCRSPIVWLGSLFLVGIASLQAQSRAQTSDVKIEEDLSTNGQSQGSPPPSPSLEPTPNKVPSRSTESNPEEIKIFLKLPKNHDGKENACPASICIPTGATFFTQLSAPALPEPPVPPAPSARVLDNMTLTLKKDGTWDLCFSMLVFEKTGVAVNWKIVVWDRETGQPMYQFAPPPVRFAQPGFYKNRHITGQTCKCDGCPPCDEINCERVFLDRSRSVVIVLPEDTRKHVYGYDAGCPDEPDCACRGPNKSKCDLRHGRGASGIGGCGSP